MRRVCVLGAGTMGSGIAAHLANLGFTVDLLDLTMESANLALDRARSLKPPHFFGPEAAARVQPGGIEADLERIREADWVCEAIVEKLELKRNLYQRILPYLRPDAMISTNTSGLELELLSEGMPEDFRRRFMGTHFFNPPRYLKLLELIPASTTDPAEVARATAFLEEHVGRRVVLARDTPGFIANRFGMWAMFHAIHVTEKLGMSIEQVDAITGPFLGRPRSGSFRLNDLVGADIMVDIAQNLISRCSNDPHMGSLATPKSLAFLLEKGWIGQKAGQGYYRKEGKEFLALDLGTLSYRNSLDVSLPSLAENAKKPLGERVRNVLAAKDEAGEFLRHHLIPVLQYAHFLRAEVSHSVQDFDRVMMWGFGWEMGPFAMMDAIGADVLGIEHGPFYSGSTMAGFDGAPVPIRDEPEYRTLQSYPVIHQAEGLTMRDLGDGVTSIGLSSKMGVISPPMVRALTEYLTANDGPMVLCGETRAFSAGFNLGFFLEKIEVQDWTGIDAALKELQDLSILLSQRRIVAAVHGYCLGAGFEVAMACAKLIAHPESSIGLPESKVGLIPGGAGTVRMRLRAQAHAKSLVEAAIHLTEGHTNTGAAEAQRRGYLMPDDVVAVHPDRLIWDAKHLALTVQPREVPQWTQPEGPIGGMIDREQDQLKAKGSLTAHDEAIGDRIKAVFTKVASTEDALVREREEFLVLCQNALSVARIRHMLESGKPLRN